MGSALPEEGPGQEQRTLDGQFQGQDGQEQERGGLDPAEVAGEGEALGQGACDGGAQHAAEGPAHGDEAEQPLGLVFQEAIAHEGPEDRHREQIEDAQPHVEGIAQGHPAVARKQAESQVEPGHGGPADPIGQGDEAPPGQPGHQGGEQRIGQEHQEQGAGHEPGEFVGALGDAEGLPHGSEEVVAEEEEEEVAGGARQEPTFARVDQDDPVQEAGPA